MLFRSEDNWQPLCASCHASVKQSIEKGWLPGCDCDGRPLEPAHPWNAPEPSKDPLIGDKWGALTGINGRHVQNKRPG